MNFTPFGTTFSSSLPNASAVAQFTTAKFAHQVSGGGGQVLGVLSADEAGVTYLRPVDANGLTFNIQQAAGNAADGSPQIITLPISVPGAKPGDLPQQQTLQIQVVNPNPGAGGGPEKYALPISLQPFQQGGATVLTVAYSNPHHEQGEAIQLQLQADPSEQVANSNNNNNNTTSGSSGDNASDETIRWDGVQVLPSEVKGNGEESGEAQAYPVAVVTHLSTDLLHRASTETITADKEDHSSQTNDKDKAEQVKREGEAATENFSSGEASSGTANSGGGGGGAGQWQSVSVPVPTTTMADYLSRLPPSSLPLSLHHFLKFSAETIKRESAIESSPLADAVPDSGAQDDLDDTQSSQQLPDVDLEDSKGGKKKKKYKKKPPKPRRPRPGQVQIAVALDGTTLFCCPECNMAYPDKEMLEQHLVAHKIERRFICDICGAGLKRKEHLERHKLGHNPERPYICSVCCKGFKRKEHLNLHFVIHSGEKSEVCPECGKGFHRKDHLRKHARSHLAKRVKEETVVGVPGIEEGLGDVGDTQDSVIQH